MVDFGDLGGNWKVRVVYFYSLIALAASGIQDLTLRTGLEGRVLLFYNDAISVHFIRAVNVRLVKEKPILVQVWQHEGEWTYSLKWQQELPKFKSLTYTDRMNYTLNVDEPFGPIMPQYRLGVYTVEDPISVPVMVANDNRSRAILSPAADPLPVIMKPGETQMQFSRLKFPYYIPERFLRLCSQSDCGLNLSSSYTAPPSKQIAVTSAMTASSGDNFLLSLPFMTVVFAWLVIITVLLLIILCVVSCFVFKKKKDNGQEDNSDTRDPGEWIIVTDDTAPSMTFNTSQSSTTICPGSSRHSRMTFDNVFPRENI